MDASEVIRELVYHYGSLYGPHLVILATLSAITLYRREMSCNHCYAEHVEQGSSLAAAAKKASPSRTTKAIDGGCIMGWDEHVAEEVLEGAGRFYSAAALAPLVTAILNVLHDMENNRNTTTEELLEGEGTLYSGERLASAIFSPRKPALAMSTAHQTSARKDEEPTIFDILPTDAQVHAMSFLHPRDVATFACASRSCDQMVNQGESSSSVWKCLWERDYAWIVESWDVGIQALRRSGCQRAITHGKEFYFRFSLSYLNYVLAGQNTLDRCLVGLHGHVYDLSLFLLCHPGSPETVMVQAGKDTTSFFEHMRHSAGARRLAQSMCVIVDKSRIDTEGCGLRPTLHTANATTTGAQLPSAAQCPMPLRGNAVSPGSLQSVYNDHVRQEQVARIRASRRVFERSILDDVNVYYDPFCSQWKGWYTDTNFETVFVNEI